MTDLFFVVVVVRSGFRALLTNALMPIKQYTVFNCLHQLSPNIGSNSFTRIPSSHLTHKTSKERHRTHTPYADTDILQTLCAYSALRLGLTKGTCNYRRTNFVRTIDSTDMYL